MKTKTLLSLLRLLNCEYKKEAQRYLNEDNKKITIYRFLLKNKLNKTNYNIYIHTKIHRVNIYNTNLKMPDAHELSYKQTVKYIIEKLKNPI